MKTKDIGIYTSKFRYLVILAGLSILTCLRYPVYLTTPNFYAEDGTEFFQNANENGLLGVLHTFNGYPIVGMRLMANVAYYFSLFPITKNLQVTAISFALVSYFFWSLLSFCTWLVLRKYVSNSLSILGSSLVLLTPLNGWNYAILGTIGNVKFGFLYIAFLLLLNRWKESKWTNFSKLVYVLCFLTNPISIILLPGFVYSFDKKHFTITKFERYFVGILTITTLIIIYYAEKYPLPSNYSEGEWDFSKLIEVTMGRTLFFPFSSSLYQSYSELLFLLISLTIASILYVFPNKNLRYFIFGVITSTTVSLITVYSRGGISVFYNDYLDPGPAQFFYAQNMMVVTSLIILIGGWKPLKKIIPGHLVALYVFLALLFLVFNIRGIGFNGLGENGKWQTEKGSINQNLLQLCDKRTPAVVDIPIMPGDPWVLSMPRRDVC